MESLRHVQDEFLSLGDVDEEVTVFTSLGEVGNGLVISCVITHLGSLLSEEEGWARGDCGCV